MKSKSIKKKIEKEFSEVQNLSKKYKTRKFACLEDAEKEILLLRKNKTIKNSKLLDINMNILKSKKDYMQDQVNISRESLRYIH